MPDSSHKTPNGDPYSADKSGSKHTTGHSSAVVPTRLLFNALSMQWQILALPWQATVYSLSLLTGAMISLTAFVGAPLPGYEDKKKLKETQKIMEHLHQREDGFRRKLKEIQGEMSSKDAELRRLQKKLGQARQEIGQNVPVRLEEPGHKKLDLSKNADKPSKLLIHCLFWICGVLPVYWLLHQPTVPGLSRKFVWSIIAPAGLLYAFGLAGDAPRFARPYINISSIFLAGFSFCHWLHTHC